MLYRAVTKAKRNLGSLEQDFVDRLVEETSSLLLAGRAWTVKRVHHGDRVVSARKAPRAQIELQALCPSFKLKRAGKLAVSSEQIASASHLPATGLSLAVDPIARTSLAVREAC